nr:MAG TPA: hypothetical protein [Bacteriophage sp.]
MAEEKSSSKLYLDDEIVYSRQEIVWLFYTAVCNCDVH